MPTKACGPASSSRRRSFWASSRTRFPCPAAAVQLGPQGPYLFVVKDGVAEVRPLVIKRTQDGESVIGKGLEDGEQVVVDGQLRLVNGAGVTVAASDVGTGYRVATAARLRRGDPRCFQPSASAVR